MKSRLLVLGGSGLVGSRFVALKDEAFEIHAPSHAACDVASETSVRTLIRDLRPHQVLYAAGFARMDAAEQDPSAAFRLNAESPTWVAEEAKKIGAPMMYLSTNAVFSGNGSKMLHTEQEAPDPISVYGKSKYAGEQAVMAASADNTVLRLISVYSADYAPRVDFARRIVADLRAGKPVMGIADDLFNPLFVDHAVAAIGAALAQRTPGVYHLGATDGISNAAFAQLIAEQLQADPHLVQPVSFEAFWSDRPTAAPRGPYMGLNTQAFRAAFGEQILTTNEQSVRAFIQHLLV
ncbi:MAG: hypothetical protein RL141_1027 [Candidatus Parcubacteria bacterium]|jgi:dTDP-4-dehydrorhamnose reductase